MQTENKGPYHNAAGENVKLVNLCVSTLTSVSANRCCNFGITTVICATLASFKNVSLVCKMFALHSPCVRAAVCGCPRTYSLLCSSMYLYGSVHITSSISMEIKRGSRHKFTHSPCFDSIQSTVCIITPVLYGNLVGPKYCSLTNPSFVFSLSTKHQSCFSTHAAHPPPTFPAHTRSRPPHPANHAPPRSPEAQNSVEPKAGWLEQRDMLGSGFVINISLFQMVPPTMQKDSTTGPGDGEGSWFGGKDKMKRKIN